MTALDDAPNIGAALAASLEVVGVRSVEELSAAGSITAWRRLRDAGLYDCASSLCALEGAIRGVPWHDIPAGERHALYVEARADESTPT